MPSTETNFCSISGRPTEYPASVSCWRKAIGKVGELLQAPTTFAGRGRQRAGGPGSEACAEAFTSSVSC